MPIDDNAAAFHQKKGKGEFIAQFKGFMSSNKGWLIPSAAFMALSLADSVTTQIALMKEMAEHHAGLNDVLLNEGNILIRYVLENYGFDGIYALKTGVPLLMGIVSYKSIETRYLTLFECCFYSLVVANNLYQISIR